MDDTIVQGVFFWGATDSRIIHDISGLVFHNPLKGNRRDVVLFRENGDFEGFPRGHFVGGDLAANRAGQQRISNVTHSTNAATLRGSNP